MQLFEKAADYQAFEQVLQDTLDQSPMRICAYAVMPNHWHLLLWPECDGELAAFMQRLTITHVRRWQEHRGYAGLGHVYQGRYKSFPVESLSFTHISLLTEVLTVINLAAIFHNTVHLFELLTEPNENTIII